MNDTKQSNCVGVGWLSDDRKYIKLRIGSKEFYMRKSKLTEKRSEHQADYLIYPKEELPEPEIDFVPEE
jgi:hypothetical protein